MNPTTSFCFLNLTMCLLWSTPQSISGSGRASHDTTKPNRSGVTAPLLTLEMAHLKASQGVRLIFPRCKWHSSSPPSVDQLSHSTVVYPQVFWLHSQPKLTRVVTLKTWSPKGLFSCQLCVCEIYLFFIFMVWCTCSCKHSSVFCLELSKAHMGGTHMISRTCAALSTYVHSNWCILIAGFLTNI